MYIDREKISRAEGYLDALADASGRAESAELSAMYDGACSAVCAMGLIIEKTESGHKIEEDV